MGPLTTPDEPLWTLFSYSHNQVKGRKSRNGAPKPPWVQSLWESQVIRGTSGRAGSLLWKSAPTCILAFERMRPGDVMNPRIAWANYTVSSDNLGL